jgi:hypothetical protein
MEVKTMTLFSELVARRSEILGEISGIWSMRKGVLNAIYQKVAHKNGDVAVKGPYYVLTRKGAGGKTVSQSIPAAEVAYVRQEAEKYKKFRQLSDEFVAVCEEISLIAGDESDDAKKN